MLIVTTHWHNFCMKVKDITRIIGEESLDIEIFEEYIFFICRKGKKKGT